MPGSGVRTTSSVTDATVLVTVGGTSATFTGCDRAVTRMSSGCRRCASLWRSRFTWTLRRPSSDTRFSTMSALSTTCSPQSPGRAPAPRPAITIPCRMSARAASLMAPHSSPRVCHAQHIYVAMWCKLSVMGRRSRSAAPARWTPGRCPATQDWRNGAATPDRQQREENPHG